MCQTQIELTWMFYIEKNEQQLCDEFGRDYLDQPMAWKPVTVQLIRFIFKVTF